MFVISRRDFIAGALVTDLISPRRPIERSEGTAAVGEVLSGPVLAAK